LINFWKGKKMKILRLIKNNYKLILGATALIAGILCLSVYIFLRPWTWKTFDHLADEHAPFTKTVELRKTQEGFQLYHLGKPFHIKGAGGDQHLDKLAKSGGNTIRTWSTIKLDSILDEAHKNGIFVIAGLNVVPARFGFDYKNKNIVETQLRRLRRDVIRYKDHPALLMWGVGNELELNALEANSNIWTAVNNICIMIHEDETNHPTTTINIPSGREKQMIAEVTPELDILTFNIYV